MLLGIVSVSTITLNPTDDGTHDVHDETGTVTIAVLGTV